MVMHGGRWRKAQAIGVRIPPSTFLALFPVRREFRGYTHVHTSKSWYTLPGKKSATITPVHGAVLAEGIATLG